MQLHWHAGSSDSIGAELSGSSIRVDVFSGFDLSRQTSVRKSWSMFYSINLWSETNKHSESTVLLLLQIFTGIRKHRVGLIFAINNEQNLLSLTQVNNAVFVRLFDCIQKWKKHEIFWNKQIIVLVDIQMMLLQKKFTKIRMVGTSSTDNSSRCCVFQYCCCCWASRTFTRVS